MRFDGEKRNGELYSRAVSLQRVKRKDGRQDNGVAGRLRYRKVTNLIMMMRCGGTWRLQGDDWMGRRILLLAQEKDASRSLLVQQDLLRGMVMVNTATLQYRNLNPYNMTILLSHRERAHPA
jgi:hypothetical protein